MWKRITPDLIDRIITDEIPVTRAEDDFDLYDFDSPTKTRIIDDKTNLDGLRLIYENLTTPLTDGTYTYNGSGGVCITKKRIVDEKRYYWDETSNDHKLRDLREKIQKELDSQFPDYEISKLSFYDDKGRIELILNKADETPKTEEVPTLSAFKTLGIWQVLVTSS